MSAPPSHDDSRRERAPRASVASERAADGASSQRPIVFFDGDCGLCHRFVRFALARDSGARLRFAPLGGETARREASALLSRGPLPDSTVVLARGELLVRAAAVARVLVELGGTWRVLGVVLGALPRALADRGYDCVAARRKRWFARPDSACPLLPAELARRIEP